MLGVLQVACVILVVLALVPALAMPLSFPARCDFRRTSISSFPIYYPGFTVLGFTEPAAIISTIVLLALSPPRSLDFWLTLVALLGLIGMHVVYWLSTHPVNNYWLRDKELKGLSSSFFSIGSKNGRGDRKGEVEWTALRDRWEYSHVVRSILATVSFISLLVACSSVGDL